jgi:membrane protease YdiL (CAAX protease family)
MLGIDDIVIIIIKLFCKSAGLKVLGAIFAPLVIVITPIGLSILILSIFLPIYYSKAQYINSKDNQNKDWKRTLTSSAIIYYIIMVLLVIFMLFPLFCKSSEWYPSIVNKFPFNKFL